MNYNIKGTAVSITDELRSYLEKKLGSLDKFVHDKEAARTDIELEFSAGAAGPKYRAEFMLHDPKLPNVLRAEANGTTLHEAIDLTIAELSREMMHTNKKRLHMLRRHAAKVKDFVRGWGRNPY